MQILRLLAARRAASPASERRDDEADFFDLDFSSCSVRASSSSSGSLSFEDSDSDSDDDECSELDFIISLQRSSSALALFVGASDPPISKAKAARNRGASTLRSLSFGARKAVPLHARPSFARSSSGRRSSSSARSFRLFVDSPPCATEDDEAAAAERTGRRAPSRDVIRRCLAKISRRIRTAAASPRNTPQARGLRRLRKCRSASSPLARRDDDSAVEKQDGIAGAIAHCKESLHRASSTSERDSPLVRSRSDQREMRSCVRLAQADNDYHAPALFSREGDRGGRILN